MTGITAENMIPLYHQLLMEKLLWNSQEGIN